MPEANMMFPLHSFRGSPSFKVAGINPAKQTEGYIADCELGVWLPRVPTEIIWRRWDEATERGQTDYMEV